MVTQQILDPKILFNPVDITDESFTDMLRLGRMFYDRKTCTMNEFSDDIHSTFTLSHWCGSVSYVVTDVPRMTHLRSFVWGAVSTILSEQLQIAVNDRVKWAACDVSRFAASTERSFVAFHARQGVANHIHYKLPNITTHTISYCFNLSQVGIGGLTLQIGEHPISMLSHTCRIIFQASEHYHKVSQPSINCDTWMWVVFDDVILNSTGKQLMSGIDVHFTH